jgi:hypothetical protein
MGIVEDPNDLNFCSSNAEKWGVFEVIFARTVPGRGVGVQGGSSSMDVEGAGAGATVEYKSCEFRIGPSAGAVKAWSAPRTCH